MGAFNEFWTSIANEVSLTLDELVDNKLVDGEESTDRKEIIKKLEQKLLNKEEIIFHYENLSERDMKKFENLKTIKFILKELDWETYEQNKRLYENKYNLKYETSSLSNLNDTSYLEQMNVNNIEVSDAIFVSNGLELIFEKEFMHLNISNILLIDDALNSKILKKILNDESLIKTRKINFFKVESAEVSPAVSEEILQKTDLHALYISNSNIDIKPFLFSENLFELVYEKMDLLNFDIFPEMPSVERLYIYHNKISDLNDLNFKFPSLEDLGASNNLITKFPKQFPVNIKNIDLSNNNITGIIDNLPQYTEFVNLINNKIEKIIFHDLDYQNEVLELSNNNISDIKNAKNFNSLNTLYIDFNPIINSSEKINKLNDDIRISIMPRVVYENKDKVIGNFGIVNNIDVVNSDNNHISDEIVSRLKYNKAMNPSYSSSVISEDDDTKFSFLISAKWGSGKTHYYKTELKEVLKKENYKPIEYSTYLNNAEDPFNTILSSIVSSKDPYIYNFFNELYKRKWLFLLIFTIITAIQLGYDYYNYRQMTQFFLTRLISPFDFVSSIEKSIPLSLSVATISLPLSLLLKNTEYLNQRNTLKRNSDNRKIIVIDDLERVKIEKQIEIVNAIQTLKEYVSVIVLMDEEEFNKSLKTYYGYDLDYKAYSSKIFDYKFEFSAITLLDYYEKSIVVKDKKLNRILKSLLRNDTSLSKLSIRDLKKLLNNLFNNISMLKQESIYIEILKLISTDVKKAISTKYQEELLKLVYMYNVIGNERNKQLIIDVLKKELNHDFYLVNYSCFNKELQNQVLELWTNDFSLENINVDKIKYKGKIKLSDAEMLIKHSIEVGVFNQLLSSCMKKDKDELLYFIFEKINSGDSNE